MCEMAALGAAIAAGIATGVWSDVTQFPRQQVSQFKPQIMPDGVCTSVAMDIHVAMIPNIDRDSRYARWREAVQRSMHWVSCEKHRERTSGRKKS